jgi:polysaccharide deacetylase 2 family uncharacterized protein YibQ
MHEDDRRSGKKNAGSFWSRLPSLYKKRLLQGIGAYLLLIAVIWLWLFLRADATMQAWNARIPQAILTLDVSGDDAPAGMQESFDGDASGNVTLPAGRTALVAIILSDAGLSEAATLRALHALPPQIALAFSPYAPKLPSWMEQAQAGGRETFLLLPMEPLTYPKDDPGPRALLSRRSESENRTNLQWLLSQATGATGVMNFMGSRFLADRRGMASALEQIKRHGLIFVENPVTAGLQSSAAFARDAGVPYLSAEMQIDLQAEENAIRRQLFLLEKAAEEKGFAIGIAAPYPVTLQVLPQWADSLARRGFTLSAPSALLSNPQAPEAP